MNCRIQGLDLHRLFILSYNIPVNATYRYRLLIVFDVDALHTLLQLRLWDLRQWRNTPLFLFIFIYLISPMATTLFSCLCISCFFLCNLHVLSITWHLRYQFLPSVAGYSFTFFIRTCHAYGQVSLCCPLPSVYYALPSFFFYFQGSRTFSCCASFLILSAVNLCGSFGNLLKPC